MAFYVDFRLLGRGLDHVHFVLCREQLAPNGDLESPLFDSAFGLRKHSAPGIGAAFTAALAAPGVQIVAVIRNSSLSVSANDSKANE